MEGSRWLRSAVSALLVLGALTAVPSMAAAATAPRVTNVNPGSGPTAGGNVVTIIGSGFTASSVVTFGAVRSARVRVESSSRLYARAPAHGAGAVYVHVRTGAGASERAAGDRYVYTTPPVALPAGANTAVLAGGYITAISCPSASFCAVVNTMGYASTFDGSTWAAQQHIDRTAPLNSVSCPSALACVAVDSAGRALTFDGASWSSPVAIDAGRSLRSVSCPNADFCMAVDDHGYNVAYSHGHWHSAHHLVPGTSGRLDAVSCASYLFCYAVGWDPRRDAGVVVRYTGTWGTSHAIGDNALDAVSCVSRLFCMVGEEGFAVVRTYTGASFSRRTWVAGDGAANSVSCVTARFCNVTWLAAQDQGQDFWETSVVDGAATGAYSIPPDYYLMTSCWAVGHCMLAGPTEVRRLG